jgi:drug/metabolite transporter (DMT)-like permease
MSTLTMAALLLDEPLTMWILIGTALVVGGVYWVTQSPKVVEPL